MALPLLLQAPLTIAPSCIQSTNTHSRDYRTNKFLMKGGQTPHLCDDIVR